MKNIFVFLALAAHDASAAVHSVTKKFALKNNQIKPQIIDDNWETGLIPWSFGPAPTVQPGDTVVFDLDFGKKGLEINEGDEQIWFEIVPVGPAGVGGGFSHAVHWEWEFTRLNVALDVNPYKSNDGVIWGASGKCWNDESFLNHVWTGADEIDEDNDWVACGMKLTVNVPATIGAPWAIGGVQLKFHSDAIKIVDCDHDPRMYGEPHIRTWGGDLFDFQGECDLVFISAPSFGRGQGEGTIKPLDIHVRTTIRDDTSFIETAALRIGEDVLEVAGYGTYFLNGVNGIVIDDAIGVLAGFPVFHTKVHDTRHDFNVIISPAQNITFVAVKDIVSVSITGGEIDDFGDSVGILGSYTVGEMLARNGHTVLHNATAFGLDWQVREDEPKLFQTDRQPQHPQEQCRFPTKEAVQALRRRLGEKTDLKHQAELACSHMEGALWEACVMDVIATGDLEMAKI